MKVYLGLGSNVGDRLLYLKKAVDLLSKNVKVLKKSCVYETPASLPSSYPEDWNRPFLNIALEIECEIDLKSLLTLTQTVEKELDRPSEHKRWSPRTIDIDILCADKKIKSKTLQVPHPFLEKRDFVLSPLRDINPSYKIKKSFLSLRRKLKDKTPAWMDIINVTPDSFSDQWIGEKSLEEKLIQNSRHSVQWIDIGGYSTRPNALNISPEEEWKRIHPAIQTFNRLSLPFMKLSVDTFRADIAKKALEEGATMINDVSGLQDPNMISVLKDSDCDYVLMHSLTVPADKKVTLGENPLKEVKRWLEEKLDDLEKNHIHMNRIIFDVGIGFGKKGDQSISLLKNIEEFTKYPVRLMVGHSRKSFMSLFTPHPASDRDAESVGASISLAQKGVDILRVHNAVMHARAWLAFRSVQ